MWLIVPRGFFSAVQDHENPDQIIVRARRREDLDAIGDLLPDAVPYRRKGSDYPWRIRVRRSAWAVACAQMAAEIDWTNFKERVGVDQPERTPIYTRVWGNLIALERAEPYDHEQDTLVSEKTGRKRKLGRKAKR